MLIREWIEKYNESEFDSNERKTQINAGWYDWFCEDYELSGRLKRMGKIIKEITNDYILDNYYVWFKNNCPASDRPLYDDFRLEPINENLRDSHYFGVIFNDERSGSMYKVFTARNGYEIEFETDYKSELIKFINKLGEEISIKQLV